MLRWCFGCCMVVLDITWSHLCWSLSQKDVRYQGHQKDADSISSHQSKRRNTRVWVVLCDTHMQVSVSLATSPFSCFAQKASVIGEGEGKQVSFWVTGVKIDRMWRIQTILSCKFLLSCHQRPNFLPFGARANSVTRKEVHRDGSKFASKIPETRGALDFACHFPRKNALEASKQAFFLGYQESETKQTLDTLDTLSSWWLRDRQMKAWIAALPYPGRIHSGLLVLNMQG